MNDSTGSMPPKCTLLSRKTVRELPTALAAAGTLFFCTAQYITVHIMRKVTRQGLSLGATHTNQSTNFFLYLFISFQAVLDENDTMVIRGQFKDGIPVSGEVLISEVVNVSTTDFPLQLKFEISPPEMNCCDTYNSVIRRTPTPSSPPSCHVHCHNDGPPVTINALAADHKAVNM